MSSRPTNTQDDTTPTDVEGPDEPLTLGGRPLRRGDRIGPYVFEQEVGSGGMARVLLARRPDGTQVALKVLRSSRFEQGLARFRREFHALSRLDHPNVVRVEAYGDLSGHPYIAMEYVDGPDLHRVIRGFRHWEDDKRYARVEEILVDLCRALAAIHRRGLVHRDLKPSNVLLTSDGVCKLTDFGIVKDLDPASEAELSTTLVGTWAYTSPEHISGEAIDHRSDLYSLGVILFSMLTGKRPFAADDMAGYLEAHRTRPAPRATRAREGVPPHLDAICARLLQKDPRDRFQSAQEILYRLEADDPDATGDGQEGWDPPLVGMEAAVEAVEESVAALTDGRGGALHLTGDDGSGRSRLLQHAMDRARMLGLPFQHHGFRADTPVYAVAIRLARQLLLEAPDDASQDLRALVAAWDDGGALAGDTRYALYDGLRQALEAVLGERPRVLLLDDVHEAPEAELDLFRYLSRTLVGEHPLRVITTSRPAMHQLLEGWTESDRPETVRLTPLSRSDLEVVVASLVGAGRAARLLARRLHTDSDGNPYFATEFLRSLMAQGLLVRKSGTWVLSLDPDDLARGHLEIPLGIRQVLRGRVEGLRPEDREVLEVLSLAGGPLDLDVLLDVIDVEEEPLLQRLDRLLLAGLAREHRGVDLLAHEVVHRRLADEVRREIGANRLSALHRALATALEAGEPQDPETLQVIGEHYRHAGDAGRAYEHLVAAAERLVDRAMTAESAGLVAHAEQVETAARGDLGDAAFRSLRLRFLGVRAALANHRGAWQEAAAALRDQLELAREAGAERLEGTILAGLSRALRRTGELDQALNHAQEALALARRLHDRPSVSEALHALAGLAWAEGDLDQCEALADEGLLASQGPEMARHRAELLMTRSAAQATRGQLTSAIRGMSEAEGLFEQLRMKTLRVIALANLAELHVWQGDTEEAWHRADEAVRLAESLEHVLGRVGAQRARGMAALDLGRYGDAQLDLQSAAEGARAIGVDEEVLAAEVLLVRLCLETSDLAGARRHGARVLTRARGPDPERQLALLDAYLARTLARTDPVSAATLLRAVDESLPTLPTPRRLQATVASAWGWLALGDKAHAIALAQQLVRTPEARAFRLLNLEARALLAATSTGEESRKHRRIGAELAREFTSVLPAATSEEVRRRPVFRLLRDDP